MSPAMSLPLPLSESSLLLGQPADDGTCSQVEQPNSLVLELSQLQDNQSQIDATLPLSLPAPPPPPVQQQPRPSMPARPRAPVLPSLPMPMSDDENGLGDDNDDETDHDMPMFVPPEMTTTTRTGPASAAASTSTMPLRPAVAPRSTPDFPLGQPWVESASASAATSSPPLRPAVAFRSTPDFPLGQPRVEPASEASQSGDVVELSAASFGSASRKKRPRPDDDQAAASSQPDQAIGAPEVFRAFSMLPLSVDVIRTRGLFAGLPLPRVPSSSRVIDPTTQLRKILVAVTPQSTSSAVKSEFVAASSTQTITTALLDSVAAGEVGMTLLVVSAMLCRIVQDRRRLVDKVPKGEWDKLRQLVQCVVLRRAVGLCTTSEQRHVLFAQLHHCVAACVRASVVSAKFAIQALASLCDLEHAPGVVLLPDAEAGQPSIGRIIEAHPPRLVIAECYHTDETVAYHRARNFSQDDLFAVHILSQTKRAHVGD